jgi:hypothetical protein
MTAAADRVRRVLTTVWCVAPAIALLVGCTASAPDDPVPSGSGAEQAGASAPPDPSTEGVIRSVVDGLNATAGGPADDQQAALRRAVDPAFVAQLDRCPPARNTLRFEPVYSALRPDPDWRGPSGTPEGIVYALPTLIRIFTGDRITGTDLGTIFVGVRDGRALLAPVCVA